MKKSYLVIVLLILSNLTYAQLDTKEGELKKQAADKEDGFKKGVIVNLALNQASFSNWAAGGFNSISASTKINYFFYYKKDNWIWDNYGQLGYGILDQENSDDIVKTDDIFEFTSKAGLKSSKPFYYAALLNLRTQMTPGYANPGDDDKISDLLAPLYVTGGIGIDYKKEDKLSVFASILSAKMTYVGNDDLADAGAFGVDPGENIKGEFGGYVKAHFQNEIMKNIQLVSKLDLFSNYLDNPQNIDVNLEVLLNMKVNKYISANISTTMIYDDDIDIAGDDDGDKAGPKLQLKEILGIGISFTL